MKTAGQELLGGREKKKFFKNDNERNLWIKLNAKRIQYCEKVVNNKIYEDLGDIEKEYTPLWISNNQLTFDEYLHNAPRFSFEELLILNDDQLLRLTREKFCHGSKNFF